MVNGRGDTPNMHDILTGSQPDGTAFAGAATTAPAATGRRAATARRRSAITTAWALDEQPPAKSWNSSHPSRGCSDDALKSTGGAGRLYCFAAK